MNTHLHVTSWVLAFILFILVITLNKQGKEKAGKILHMILRLTFLIILYSGGDLFSNYLGTAWINEVIIKTIAGIWIMVAIEMVLVKMKKNKPTLTSWIQLIIAVAITFVLGFVYLPGGFLP